MSSLPQSIAVKTLEGLIQRTLALDPSTRARLADFHGKRVYIEARSPALGLLLSIEHDSIRLSTQADRHPHATIEAPTLELLKMAFSDETHFLSGPVSVNGDVRLVQALHAIARDLDINWETGLSRLFGKPLVRPVSRGIQQLVGFANRMAGQFLQQAGSRLRDEQALAPLRWELDEFQNDNRDLCADLDRLESRLARLQKRLDSQSIVPASSLD